MLPDSLIYLWKKGIPGHGFRLKTPSHSLPELLKFLEPCLNLTDYMPMLEHFRLVFWIGFGIFLVPMWACTIASIFLGIPLADSWWMLAACAGITALMFLIDSRCIQPERKRRTQQMNWALVKRREWHW
jgi:hypothetical protein